MGVLKCCPDAEPLESIKQFLSVLWLDFVGGGGIIKSEI